MFNFLEGLIIYGYVPVFSDTFKIKRKDGCLTFGPFYITDNYIDFHIQKVERHLFSNNPQAYTTFLFGNSSMVEDFIYALNLKSLFVEFHFVIEKIVKNCCFSMYDDCIEKYVQPKLKQKNFGIFLL